MIFSFILQITECIWSKNFLTADVSFLVQDLTKLLRIIFRQGASVISELENAFMTQCNSNLLIL
jgi:hypothetical protein